MEGGHRGTICWWFRDGWDQFLQFREKNSRWLEVRVGGLLSLRLIYSSPHHCFPTVNTKKTEAQGQTSTALEHSFILLCGDFLVWSFHSREYKEGKLKTWIQPLRFTTGLFGGGGTGVAVRNLLQAKTGKGRKWICMLSLHTRGKAIWLSSQEICVGVVCVNMWVCAYV